MPNELKQARARLAALEEEAAAELDALEAAHEAAIRKLKEVKAHAKSEALEAVRKLDPSAPTTDDAINAVFEAEVQAVGPAAWGLGEVIREYLKKHKCSEQQMREAHAHTPNEMRAFLARIGKEAN